MTTIELDKYFDNGTLSLVEDGIGYRTYIANFNNEGYDKASYAIEIDIKDGCSYIIYNAENGEATTKAQVYPYEVGHIARTLQKLLHGADV